MSGGPRPLGEVLRHLAARYRKLDLEAIDEVRRRWPTLVDEALATTCAPEAVRDGVLIVRVPTGAYAERLRVDEGAILRALADLGSHAPTSLRVVVGARTGAPKRP